MYDYGNVKQGQKVIISNGVMFDSCCDCGLTHKRIFKIENLKFKGDEKPSPTVTMRTYRADKMTANERKKKRHLFIEDKNITVGELRKL